MRRKPPGRVGSGEPMLVVRQVRSAIGVPPKQRRILRALGLRRRGRAHRLPDRPEIRGMLAHVPHLVRIERVDNPGGKAR